MIAGSHTADVQGGGGVDQGDRSRRSLDACRGIVAPAFACQNAPDQADALLESANADVGGLAFRLVEIGGSRPILLDFAAGNLPDFCVAGNAELVGPVASVCEQHVLGAQQYEGVCHPQGERGIGDSDHLMSGAGRASNWSEDVKDRPDAYLGPERAGMLHGRMEGLGEHERHPDLFQATPDALRLEVDLHAESFKRIGASGGTARGTVTVFGYGDAGSRCDKRRSRGDIELV